MTAMLDALTQAQIWQAVLEHARQHQLGVLVVSHNGPLLDRLCSRVVEMPSVENGP
jgi:peptide/nickel transport system ATP-binding protein